MKTLIAFILALASQLASAQTPADCAVTYRNDNAWQGQLTSRVGSHWQNQDYTWAMAVPFQLPSGPVAAMRFTLPTWGSGAYDSVLNPAGTGTVNIVVVNSYDSAATCGGHGPFYTFSVPPVQTCKTVNRQKVCTQSNDSTLAGTIVTPLVTGDLVIDVNAAGIAAINALKAQGRTDVVIGVSMVVPRVNQLVDGELKKRNVYGMVINMDRLSKCEPTFSPYCPSATFR